MNKHKLYSAMHDENKEQSQTSKDYQQFRHAVKVFTGKYGITETTNVIRQEIEEENKNDKFKRK